MGDYLPSDASPIHPVSPFHQAIPEYCTAYEHKYIIFKQVPRDSPSLPAFQIASMTKKQSIVFASILLILALVWAMLHRPTTPDALSHSEAPDFSLTAIEDGKQIQLSDYQGKVKLIVFWATWCAPCLAEIPTLKNLQNELGPKGFQIIGISLDDGPEPVVSLHSQVEFNYPVLMGTQETVAAYGNFTGIPTSFLVDRKGFIHTVIPGLVGEGALRELILSAISPM